ncbi:MAG TPA: zinc dependent phospholipase C family protein [Puia sp.]|nr:zinc dependent phospholipase C family protein [Puia sp.]
MSVSKTLIRLTATLLLVLSMKTTHAYSILAHEALIDSCWASTIRPLLLAKFPGSTDAQLKTAHAYAYGGAIAPDIGYFPFGSPFFTNLVHYVRSGDFVNALLADARDINEYAFAIGFLSHYMADRYGHSLATNKSVPLLYPKVRKKHGNWVTYEENPLAHKRVEFGYDVLQTVEGDYTKIAYHDFIGFEISDGLLERAFTEVYGLDIHKVFPVFSLSSVMLRWSFKRLFPVLTGTAWILKKNQLKKAHSPDGYKGMQAKGYRANVFSGLVAFVVTVLPKVGPLRVMKFRPPGPVVAKLYYSSFDTIVERYGMALRACREGTSRLANVDFDTGNFTAPAEYGLADKSYDKLVVKLKKNKFRRLNGELRENIVDYYSCRVAPLGGRRNEHAWNKTEAALHQLEVAKNGAAD